MSEIFSQALKAVWIPLLLALLVTPIRFMLEFTGLPEYAIFYIGLLWFTLGLSVYWGVKFHFQDRAFLLLFVCLLILSPISRVPVAVAWWLDKTYELGTHYGLYFDSFIQALLNHVVYGSFIQLIPSLILGGLTIKIMQSKKHRVQDLSQSSAGH